MKKVKRFILNAIILIVAALIIKYLTVAFNVYISNKIGAQGMGIYGLLMSVYMLAITVASSGISLGTTRLVAEEMGSGKSENIRAAVRKCFCYSMVASISATILLVFSANFIAKYWLHNEISSMPIYAVALSLPFISISSVFDGYFISVRRVIKSASADIFEQFAKIAITVYLLMLFMPKGIDYACLALALGGAIAEILSCLYMFILYLWDKKRYSNRSSNTSHLTKKLLKISIPVAISSCVRAALATFKQIIIPIGLTKSGITHDDALANYGMIRGMVMPIIMFPSALLSAFSELLIPEIAEKFIQKKNAHIKLIISRIFKITLIFSICVTGILFFYSDELSMAIYKSYDTAFYIKIFAPLVVIMYFDNIVDSILKGINQQVSVVGINILDTIISIALLMLLLPKYSVTGYIIVIFVSEITNGGLSIMRLIKVTSFELKFFSWIIMPSILIVTSVIFAKQFMRSNLILSISVAIILYLIFLFVTKIIKKEDFTL